MIIRLIGGVLGSALVLSAGSVPIGILTTIDSVRINKSQVRGSGTVLDGSVIETAKNPSQLNLRNGTRFDLYPNSRATVFNDRVVLDRGASQIHVSTAYPIVVNALSIVPLGPSSTIRVSRNSSKTLVAAVTGQAEVRNAKGLLIARVVPGSALDFDQPVAGAAGPIQINGKVSKQNGHYLLTDSTNTTVELEGDSLDSAFGHCIAVMGSADPSAAAVPGATGLIHVSTFKQVVCAKVVAVTSGAAAGGAAAGGGGAAAGGAAAGGAAVGAGLSAAAIGGIVTAGAVGGTLGGLAAAGGFSSGKSASQ